MNNEIELLMPIKATPYEHQKNAFAFACDKFGVFTDNIKSRGTALLMEMGTGKTIVSIAVAGCMYRQKKINRVLVVAPLSILGVWQEEFEKFADFPYSLTVLKGSSAKKKEQLKKLPGNGLQVVVVNYESSWRLEKELLTYDADLIIADEAHKLKENRTSPTLRAGVVPAAVAIENHPTDGRVKIEDDDKVQTLTSRMGTGGMNVPLVLKIRSGCEGGGKGALIQTDKSATLATGNDQTVFVPTVFDGKQVTSKVNRSNPQPGDPCHTIAAASADSAFVCYGICSDKSNSMKSGNPHSGVYEAETARTIDGNGVNPGCNQGGIAVVCVDQGGGKSSCAVSEKVAPTLACTHGGEPAVCIQGSMIGRKDGNGPQGSGINEDVAFTLNATDRHAVYAMTTGSFPNTGEDVAPALLARDYKDATIVTEPSYGIGRDAFNQGKNAQFKPCIEEELSPTLVAKGPGAVAWNGDSVSPTLTANNAGGNQRMPDKSNFNSVVEPDYTVRRLTPTECARLQGFPDWWCSDLGTKTPSYADIAFWSSVFETHRKIVGEAEKPKTQAQIIKWLKDPYSDAAEYKMWGNGVALPCVYFVLAGILWNAHNTDNKAQ